MPARTSSSHKQPVTNDPRMNLINKDSVLAAGFAQMPLPIMAMTEISSSAKQVWMALSNRARPGGGGRIYPTLATIAFDTGLSRNTVIRAIGELITVKPYARRNATSKKKNRQAPNPEGMLVVVTHHDAPSDYFICNPSWISQNYNKKIEATHRADTRNRNDTRYQDGTGGSPNLGLGWSQLGTGGSPNMGPKEEKAEEETGIEKGKAAAAETSPLEGVEVDALVNQLKDLPGNPHTNAQYLLNQIATLLATADSFGPPPTRVAIITTARKAAKDLVTWNNREPLRSFKRAAHCVATQVVSAPAEKKHTRHGIHHYEEDQ